MKKLPLLIFILFNFFVNHINGQIPFHQESYLNLRVHYISGDQTERNNYKWLNPETGKDAFLYLSEIQIESCNCPEDSSKGLGIFKSFTLVGRWFNLLGEFAANPGIMYEYVDDFSFTKNGEKYNINKKLLAKYPPLLKRLKYAAPLSMDYTLRFDAADKQGDRSGLELIVKDIDLLIPAENEMPYMVAGAPSKWSDRIIIGNYINQDEIEIKKRWANLTEVSNQASLVINNFTLPVDEFIAISNLYKQYEKENKDLKDEFKMLEPDYKPATVAKPYTKSDEWSKPYEPEVRIPELFAIDGKVGIRNGKRIVFESTQHYAGEQLYEQGQEAAKFFKFQVKSTTSFEVFNAKGSKVSIDGISLFNSIKSTDTEHVFLCNKSSAPAYTTRMKFIPNYSFSDFYYTAEGLAEIKNEDEEAYNTNLDPMIAFEKSNLGSGFLPKRINIYKMDVITTDKNLRIIKKEVGYTAYNN